MRNDPLGRVLDAIEECDDCDDDGRCREHDVKYREAKRVDEMEQERMERLADPNMHNSVDAPRF